MDLGVVALVSIGALLGPAVSLAARGAIPVVVGQLLAGLVLGKTGLRIIDPAKADLALLYDIGFAVLMFTVGMHVPLRDQRLRPALRSGALAAAVTLPLALAGGLLCRAAGGGPVVVYAVIIVSSSAAVALPVIEEGGLRGSAVLTAMAWITIADIGATVAIPLAIRPSRAGHAAVGALVVAAAVLAVLVAARALRHTDFVKRMRHQGKLRGWAIDLRLAVIVLLGLGYIAQQVGASLLVAGFGTGLVVAAIGGPKRLSTEVLGLGQGFFVPLFFVMLGAKLDLRALDQKALVLVGVLAAVAITVHLVAALAIRVPLSIGLLASAQMGVPAAVIALGLQAHAVSQGQASAIFCVTLISIGVCAVGAAMLRSGESRVGSSS